MLTTADDSFTFRRMDAADSAAHHVAGLFNRRRAIGMSPVAFEDGNYQPSGEHQKKEFQHESIVPKNRTPKSPINCYDWRKPLLVNNIVAVSKKLS